MLYTTKSGAKVLGVKQDTLKHYARRFGVGSQPGGPGTPYLFDDNDIKEIRSKCRRWKWYKVESQEDREALGLGAMFNDDLTPRKSEF